jgi:hypothetical protein
MEQARLSTEAEARQLLAARGLDCLRTPVSRHRVHANAIRDKIPISQYPGPVAARVRAELNGVLSELLAARPHLLGQAPAAVAGPVAAG